MKRVLTTIFSSVILLTVLVSNFPVKQAEAQWVVEFGPAATTLISGILAATTSTAVVSGVPGIGATTVATARESVGSACLATIVALDATDGLQTVLDSTSTATLSVVGGSPFEFTKLNVKLAKATAAKTCVDTYVEILSRIPGVTFEVGQEVAREQDKYTKVSNSLRQQIQDLSAQQNASAKDIMKAFMVKLVLNLNKNLTTKVVNELLQEYKINDYLAYGDALATQVYAMKYIDQNFDGDARTQMMMRSLIQSEKVPQKARVAAAFANQQAQEHLKANCGAAGQLNAADSTSLNCLAAYGSEQSSPMYMYLNALDTSQQIKSQAQKTAQAEISQSDGYAPPRNCGGSVSQQAQIDAQIEAATNERDAALSVVIRMTDALSKGQTTDAEFTKAQAAYEAAEQKFANLPQAVSQPVIDICEAIDSPAKFVASSVQDYLKQHFDQGSELQTDNLPFYANFLADLTGNFLTNVLTGGKSTSKVFKEAGVAALGAGIASVPSIIGGNGSSDASTEFGNPWVLVYITPVGSTRKVSEVTPGQQYTFNVDISGHIKEGRERPNRIVIRDRDTNEAIVNQTVGTSDLMQYNFTAQNRTVKWEVEISVREGDGARILDTVTGAYFIAGDVAGVQTVSFTPRGQLQTFQPR